MTQPSPKDVYERAMKMLGPALERVASDPEFRQRLELTPLDALAEMHVELDEETRRDLEGRRFSEFWAMRQQAAEGVVGVRDLPPADGALSDSALDSVVGGFSLAGGSVLSPDVGLVRKPRQPVTYAPPYVPVGPVNSGE